NAADRMLHKTERYHRNLLDYVVTFKFCQVYSNSFKIREICLKRLVTGDETWILYQNVHRKRTWSKENRPSTVPTPKFHFPTKESCPITRNFQHALESQTNSSPREIRYFKLYSSYLHCKSQTCSSSLRERRF
ncbi:hypothetical protein WN51_11368, partial [Melipona quadrifasciata]